jgi:acyl-CoA synthetase (AMP-forming)/AMP-acid ligase II
MLQALMHHPRLHDYDLSTLTGLGYGAAPMPPDVLAAAIEHFGPIFYAGLGMTELSGMSTNLTRDMHLRAASGDQHLLLSCGKPMSMVMIRLVRPDMTDCDVDEVGELVFRGEQVLRGYWNNDEGTRRAFEGDWFHGGDLARVDAEGFVYIVDRLKDMIVSGGENVYSSEVEAVLARDPAVREVAVIGLADDYWGERVTAVVVPHDGCAPDEAGILARCRTELGGYKVPKQVIFTTELPKNVSGKILKQELREAYAATPTA